ncbi:MAG: sulfite exporter TauE/SafE family protein [Candidatus Methanosuratincola petrocarbonis]|nr:sulfite exporter TauE/SafE family protein [Candidatus Methanosuratincola sp.]
MELYLMALAILLFGIFAGSLGAMLGLGGGVLMIIFLLLALNLPAHQAVALSLIAVIASSSMAGSVYIKDRMTNLKLAMVLEVFTVSGAVAGAYLAIAMPVWVIQALLGCVLFYTSITMFRERKGGPSASDAGSRERAEESVLLAGEFYDVQSSATVSYGVKNLKIGTVTSFIAGAVSGMVGIGGGVIKVPIMNLVMKIPIKAAAATSNFMVGVTAAASAVIYFESGLIDLKLAAPTIMGIMIGAYIGTKLLARSRSTVVRRVLAVVLSFFGAVLLLKAGGILAW